MNQALPVENQEFLLEEFDLGSARGGAKPAGPLEVHVVRALSETDLPAIASPPPVAAPGQSIASIRHSHHRIAQLQAEGKKDTEISFITGYSLSRLSILKGDPAFAELVSYYEAQREAIFVNAQERLRDLGLDGMEKLHERLHDPNEKWTHGQLMDLIKMAMPAETSPKAPTSNTLNVTAGGDAALEIKFVGARPAGGQVVEGQFTEVNPQTKG